MKSKTVFIFIVIFYSQSVSQDISSMLAKYTDQARVSSFVSIPDELLKENNAQEVVRLSYAFFTDTVINVRAKIYLLVGKIGATSRQLATRQAVLNQLLRASKDKDGSNVGLLWSVFSQFRKNDFSESAKDTLRTIFRSKPFHLDKLLKLIGYLEMADLQDEIRPLTLLPNSGKDRWAALISLSRMGDNESTQLVLQKTKKIKMNDDVIYEVFPDLIYTRRYEIFNHMIDVLNSDEKNCLSADAENELPILCGYRIMEQLAPVINPYPLQLDESGDIKAKDYAKALTDVRRWFKDNKTNYKINKDSF